MVEKSDMKMGVGVIGDTTYREMISAGTTKTNPPARLSSASWKSFDPIYTYLVRRRSFVGQ